MSSMTAWAYEPEIEDYEQKVSRWEPTAHGLYSLARQGDWKLRWTDAGTGLKHAVSTS